MDADVKQVVVFVNQADGLLFFTIVVDGLQAIKTAHAMIDVGHKITGLQVVEFFDGQGFFPAKSFPQVKTVVAVENLVIRITQQLNFIIDKTRAQTYIEGFKMSFPGFRMAGLYVFKNGVEAFGLFGIIRQDEVGKSGFRFFAKIVNEQPKVLLKTLCGD